MCNDLDQERDSYSPSETSRRYAAGIKEWNTSSPDIFNEQITWDTLPENNSQYASDDHDDQVNSDELTAEELYILELQENEKCAAHLEKETMLASDAALAACLEREERDTVPTANMYSSVERDAQAAMEIYTRDLAYARQLQCDEEYARSLAQQETRNVSHQPRHWQTRTPPFTRSQTSQNQQGQVYQQVNEDVYPDFASPGMNQPVNVSSDDYEELWMLEAEIGDAVDKGLKSHELDVLPTQIYSSPQVAASASSRTELAMNKYCAICQENFTSGENLRTLPCLHRFHQECMDTWLKTKAVCPICNLDVKEHLIQANN